MEALTELEQAALQSFDKKMEHIRVKVCGVVMHYDVGMFLWGEGGHGKSHTVINELERLEAKYVLHNSRLTARGLVDALEQFPSDVHVIEDAETLLDDKKASGVLRSALHSQSTAKPSVRTITWGAFQTQIRFSFTGGIIVISNSNLAQQIPEIRAIKSRITVLHMDVSNEELLALMKRICLKGFRYGSDVMCSDECWEVASAIKQQLHLLQRPLDLRLLNNSFRDYVQWKNGDSGKLHWRDLLVGRMKEAVTPQRSRREDRIAEEARLAAQIDAMPICKWEKLRLWIEQTTHKTPQGAERSFYRRLRDYDRMTGKCQQVSAARMGTRRKDW